jgi:hypothetical protein
MLHRFISILGLSLLLPLFLVSAQQTKLSERNKPAGIPKIECSLTLSEDSLFFVGYDYVPNTITATVKVKNVGVNTADTIIVSMLADTRFVIVPPVIDTLTYALQPGDSIETTFVLQVASARDSSGLDIVQAVATASNGSNSQAAQSIWVEKERFPVYQLKCSNISPPIVFDDALNGYTPDPFQIQVEVTNIGDGNSDETQVAYLGTRGVEPAKFPIISVGTIAMGAKKSVTFDLRAIKRLNDTTVALFFQVQGFGGYKKKMYTGECQVLVDIPMSKKADYTVIPNVVPDQIVFVNHTYSPDPFTFTATIQNVGTAVGDSVRAQVILPPSIQLNPGQDGEQYIGVLGIDSVRFLSWQLKPNTRLTRDTVKIYVRVYDRFGNQAIQYDSVIVDPILQVQLTAACTVPDTIYADKLNGVYLNNPFNVSVTARNIGTDYADSVKATVIIQSADVVLNAPSQFEQRWADISPTGTDKLYPDSVAVFTWSLKALARGISGPITIKFKVEALNASTEQPECSVYIPNLEAPALETQCSIDVDSLHYNPVTGGYTPDAFIYTLRIWNSGGGKADSVLATLALPPRVYTEEALEKFTTPLSLGPKDTCILQWRLIPLERHDFGSLATVTTITKSTNVSGTYQCDASVFIPALPNTAALSITKDNVGYTGQSIYVPVHIDQTDDKDIKSFDIGLKYNVDENRNPLPVRVVDFRGIEQRQSMTDGWNCQTTTHPGDSVHIVLQSPGLPLTGGSPPPLFYLVFEVVYGGDNSTKLGNARTCIAWPLDENLKRDVLINNGAIFPRVKDGDGMIWVSGDCLRPLNASDKYFFLGQNSPNPFNPSTSIVFNLAEETQVRISVSDALGRNVAVLVDGVMTAGPHNVSFNAGNLPTGLYFYKMECPQFSKVMKMMLAK